MFRKGTDTQINLNDRMLFANSQAVKAVESSRAKLIGDYIYPNVDEGKFSSLFSDVGSRPNIEIRQYVSALVLKRMYGLTDAELIEFLRCGALNFQYALHTTQADKQPISESSLRRFRRRVEAYNKEHETDLIKGEFERISKWMAIKIGVLREDPNENEDDVKPILVRMDSMEIEAHAKAMTRIEILYTSIAILIRYLLKRDNKELIPAALGHYLEDGDHNKVMYYRVAEDKKAGVQDTRVAELVQEMTLIQRAFTDNFTAQFLAGIAEYQVFQRVLEEQTRLDENGCRVPKDKGEITANSVQNPFDATVTYRYKRGQHHGHVLNVTEAIDGQGNGIIIQATVDQNTQSDSRMAEDYVESQPENGPKQTVSLDGGYNSERLEELAKKKNIDIQTTSLTGKETPDVFADFELNDEGTEIISCPEGKTPVSCKYNVNTEKITAVMPENCCATCQHRDECRAKVNNKKNKSTVQASLKSVKRARHARNFSSEEGKANAHRRNGVEGIMSVMRRKYGVDHIPVFGQPRLKLWIWTSLLSYNLVKLNKYQRSVKQPVVVA